MNRRLPFVVKGMHEKPSTDIILCGERPNVSPEDWEQVKHIRSQYLYLVFY